jgi:hypothetical protein
MCVLFVAAAVAGGLLATAIYVVRQQQARLAEQGSTPLTPEQKAQLKQRMAIPMQVTLAVAAVGFGTLVILYAFLRWSRHFRSQLGRASRPPTPVEDVWSMHRPPPEVQESNGDSSPDETR